jgi:hypothetical protein
MSDVPSHESTPAAGGRTNPSSAQEETKPADQTRPVIDAPPPPMSAAPPQQVPPRQSRTRAQAAQQRSSPQPGTRRQYSPQRAAAAPPPPAPPQQMTAGRARQRSRQRQQPIPPGQSGLYLPWWSLVIMVGTVGVVAFGLLFAFTQLSEPAAPGDQLPRIQIVTSQPTLSQDFSSSSGQAAAPQDGAWPTAIPQAQPSATVPLPTPIPTQTLPPGDFSIGMRVQVVGVDVVGLNIRAAPGTAGTIQFLAAEGDEFALVDGPQDVDGYEWWKLEDPGDSRRVGWAARNFLMVASQ